MNVAELERRHTYEKDDLDAEFEMEKAQHFVEIKKRINMEHEDEVKKRHKALLEKVRLFFIVTTSIFFSRFPTEVELIKKTAVISASFHLFSVFRSVVNSKLILCCNSKSYMNYVVKMKMPWKALESERP